MGPYVLTLSKVFPASHPKAGEPTGFKDKFLAVIGGNNYSAMIDFLKYHTIRANYELWRKRFDEIEAGKACLSVRQWTGKPYRSKQIELARLTKDDGIGLQKLSFLNQTFSYPAIIDYPKNRFPCDFRGLAINDGLTLDDWYEWFKNYDFSKPLAIIHFTGFRY